MLTCHWLLTIENISDDLHNAGYYIINLFLFLLKSQGQPGPDGTSGRPGDTGRPVGLLKLYNTHGFQYTSCNQFQMSKFFFYLSQGQNGRRGTAGLPVCLT